MTWMVLGLGVGLIIFAYMNGRTAGRDRVIAVQAGQTAERMKQNAKIRDRVRAAGGDRGRLERLYLESIDPL